jgi:high-affinity K+ transport system ATPase subunit B
MEMGFIKMRMSDTIINNSRDVFLHLTRLDNRGFMSEPVLFLVTILTILTILTYRKNSHKLRKIFKDVLKKK